MTALLAIGAVISGSPVALLVALPVGLTAYFMYYHGSGKLAQSVYRREQTRRRRQTRGGFGAGPRSRGDPRTRAERETRARFTERGPRTSGYRDSRDRAPYTSSGPTRSEARTILGVGPTADAAEIKGAYRERVKDVHPDRGGDEDEFKQVTAAYDRLR